MGKITDEWRTPPEFFDKCRRAWGDFNLDVAATPENALCPLYYTEKEDGLTQPWTGRVWCNPPYSRIAPWVEKARIEANNNGAEVVMLLPNSTGAQWFHENVQWADTFLLRGRISFLHPNFKGGSPRGDNMLMVFARKRDGYIHTLDWRDPNAP